MKNYPDDEREIKDHKKWAVKGDKKDDFLTKCGKCGKSIYSPTKDGYCWRCTKR